MKPQSIEPGTTLGDVICPWCSNPTSAVVGKQNGHALVTNCDCGGRSTAPRHVSVAMKREYIAAQQLAEGNDSDENTLESEDASQIEASEEGENHRTIAENSDTSCDDGDTGESAAAIAGTVEPSGAGTGDGTDDDTGQPATGRWHDDI